MYTVKDYYGKIISEEQALKEFDIEYNKLIKFGADSEFPNEYHLFLYTENNLKDWIKNLFFSFSGGNWVDVMVTEENNFDYYETPVKGLENFHQIIKDFFKNNTEYLKNEFIKDIKKIYINIKIPNLLILFLEKIENNKKIDKLEILECLKNTLGEGSYNIIKSEIIFEKIEIYIKENNIENIYFKNREEINGQENVINFFRENLVVPY